MCSWTIVKQQLHEHSNLIVFKIFALNLIYKQGKLQNMDTKGY